MKILLVLPLFFFHFLLAAQQQWPEKLILTPERSNFTQTSSHADVMAYLEAIQALSPDIKVFSMGKSVEGKDIPVAVLARPAVVDPAVAKTSGKLIIYVQGNIHAGEVEGKEVLMMLMRDILLGDKNALLDNLIILFAPIYNADGNDKMEKGRRPSQEDSPAEVGVRENSQGLDLNRDGVKMEAVETKGLFEKVILAWDPMIFVDLHTTNGTWHAWNLTWAPSYAYAGDPATSDYTLKMLKDISATAARKYDLHFGPYGDYDLRQGWPPKDFYTYNHHPRYLVNQFSLRNRIAILSEAFAHERFYQRIHSTYSFVTEILLYAQAHAKEIIDVNKQSEIRAMEAVKAGQQKKGVRFTMDKLEVLDKFPTYDHVGFKKEDGSQGYYRTGRIVEISGVTYHAKFTPEVESKVPAGYIIPPGFPEVVDNLRDHGITVTETTRSTQFKGEVFEVATLEKSPRKFEGHTTARASGKFLPAERKFSKGHFVIDLAQPLGNLAFYLLEPESDDGLVTWNFFDAHLEKEGIGNKKVNYPVFKYYK